MNDNQVVDALNYLGIDQKNAKTLALLPVVHVAWAEGDLAHGAQERILEIGKTEFGLGDDALIVVKSWLRQPPSPQYVTQGQKLLVELAHRKQADAWGVTKGTLSTIIDTSKTVAKSNVFGRRKSKRRVHAAQKVDEALTRPPNIGTFYDTPIDPEDEVTQTRTVGGFELSENEEQPTEIVLHVPSWGPPTHGMLFYERPDGGPLMLPIDGRTFTMGRQSNCEVQIKWDGMVSRQHCQFRTEHGQVFVKDLGAMNGTLVNGERIAERQLFGCERVTVGDCLFEYAPGPVPWPDYDQLDADGVVARLASLDRSELKTLLVFENHTGRRWHVLDALRTRLEEDPTGEVAPVPDPEDDDRGIRLGGQQQPPPASDGGEGDFLRTAMPIASWRDREQVVPTPVAFEPAGDEPHEEVEDDPTMDGMLATVDPKDIAADSPPMAAAMPDVGGDRLIAEELDVDFFHVQHGGGDDMRTALPAMPPVEEEVQTDPFGGDEPTEDLEQAIEQSRIINLAGETIEAGDEAIEAGDETIEAGDEAIEAGDETIEAGDETIEAGDETIEAGDEAGDETIEAGDEADDAATFVVAEEVAEVAADEQSSRHMRVGGGEAVVLPDNLVFPDEVGAEPLTPELPKEVEPLKPRLTAAPIGEDEDTEIIAGTTTELETEPEEVLEAGEEEVLEAGDEADEEQAEPPPKPAPKKAAKKQTKKAKPAAPLHPIDLIEGFLFAVSNKRGTRNPLELRGAKTILDADKPVKAVCTVVAIRQLCGISDVAQGLVTRGTLTNSEAEGLKLLADRSLRAKLPFDELHILRIVEALPELDSIDSLSVPLVLSSMERALADAPPSPDLVRALTDLVGWLAPQGAKGRKLCNRVNNYLRGRSTDTRPYAPDKWGKKLDPWFEALDAETRNTWCKVFLLARQGGRRPRPTARWLTRAQEGIASVGVDDFRDQLVNLLEAFDAKAGLDPANYDLLIGFVYMSVAQSNPEVVRAVDRITRAALTDEGKAMRIANAGVVALAWMPASRARRVLDAIAREVPHKGIQRRIQSLR